LILTQRMSWNSCRHNNTGLLLSMIPIIILKRKWGSQNEAHTSQGLLLKFVELQDATLLSNSQREVHPHRKERDS
jgi:mannose/fructose/N-acetylgalactosamine-specific phosphotransferase system component IID